MQWLAPMTALAAAAITVPLLVALYFLKLKRSEQWISSTLLWKRAVQDLQVNAPFQRLRRNILLLLQLLALLAILAALGRPVMSLTAGPSRKIVLLIDRSASMNATDVRASRLDAAKAQAKVLVDSLRGKAAFSLHDSSDQAMVIAFDDHAKVMCNFTSDKRQLAAAIDSIKPTDAGSSLSEAVVVARAFAQSAAREAENVQAAPNARLDLFSDGRIRDLEQILLGPEELAYHCVGQSGDNLAVTAMQARRSYEKAEQVEVFATLTNYSPAEVTAEVQLALDGNIRSVRSVTVGGLVAAEGSEPARPGRASVSFGLSHAAASVVEVRQLRRDVLPGDDAAWAILPAPRKLTALLVTGGNVALQSALRALPLERLDVKSPQEWNSSDPQAGGAEGTYDVIVLDNLPVPAPPEADAGASAARLPPGRYVIFGRPPAGTGVATAGRLTNQITIDWRSRHPILQHVNLANLFASKCWKMDLPADAEILSEFADGPGLVLLRRGPSVMLLAGFDVLETNWPFEPSFVMFCYNAMTYLGLELASMEQTSLDVGQPIAVEGVRPGLRASLFAPGADKEELSADAGGTIRFAGTDRAGVYTLAVDGRQPAHFAVNLLDATESDIGPAFEISLSGRKIQAQAKPVQEANVELWPFLAALVLALVCLEWFVYNSKARL